jgi:hypothetical protein
VAVYQLFGPRLSDGGVQFWKLLLQQLPHVFCAIDTTEIEPGGLHVCVPWVGVGARGCAWVHGNAADGGSGHEGAR